jgi:hypothetical protein
MREKLLRSSRPGETVSISMVDQAATSHLAKQTAAAWDSTSRGYQRIPWNKDVEDSVAKGVLALRAAGHPVTMLRVRGLLTACLGRSWFATHTLSDWCVKAFLKRNDFSLRQVTTKDASTPVAKEFVAVVESAFLIRVAATIRLCKIFPEMVVNADQTGVLFFSEYTRTYEKRGVRRVKINTTANNKQQVTAMLATSASGNLLPPQVIFAGKTVRCLKDIKDVVSTFSTWNITWSPSHWSTTETMVLWVEKILVPYYDQQRRILGQPDAAALLLLGTMLLILYNAH